MTGPRIAFAVMLAAPAVWLVWQAICVAWHRLRSRALTDAFDALDPEPWVSGQDMPTEPLSAVDLIEAQRLIDGAFTRETH